VRRALRFGAGVRGAQSLVLAAKAVSMLDGRAHVAFSDIQRVAKPVLRHRLIRSFEVYQQTTRRSPGRCAGASGLRKCS